MCKQGGNASEFELMCRGGKIAQQAVETVKQAAQEGRIKDALRSEVASLIIKAISMYFQTNIGIILTDCRRNHTSKG
jgi:methionine aminopeptidase